MPHSRMAVEQSSTVDEFSRLLTPGAEDGSVNAETDLLTGGPGAVKVLRQELQPGTGTTVPQTFANIVKATMGAGSFAFPYCMMNMGVAPGVATMLLLAALCVYTIMMLVRVKNMTYSQTFKRDLTYVDVATHAFGNYGRYTVYAMTIWASLGGCASYMFTIGDQMAKIVPGVSIVAWQAISLAIFIPLAWLRNLKQLSYTSVVGSFFVVAAMVVTIIYGIIYNSENFKTFQPDWVSSGYFKAFGSVAFLYCIHVLILPIERAMIRHTKFLHTLSSAFAVMATFNTLFALLCYFFWGDDTSDFILKNLMREDEDGQLYYDTLGIIVVIAVCLDLVFTYPLILSSSREIIEVTLVNPQGKYVEATRNVIRTVLVLFTWGIAGIGLLSTEGFGLLTNLTGISLAFLAFVMPPMMELKLVGPLGRTKGMLISHSLLALLGVALCILTLVTSIEELVNPNSD